MHNFENQDELVASGKKFPLRGKLKGISSFYFSLFGYISDDYTFVWVELRQAVLLELQKSNSINTYSSALNPNIVSANLEN